MVWSARGTVHGAMAMLTVSGRTPLVGRERELARIRAHLETAVRGRCAVVLLVGEPGSGKSRLLDETAERAGAHGIAVLRGGASDAEGMPPYLPFLEALGRYLLAAPADELRADAGAGAAVLAMVFPELAVRLGDLPQSYPLPPEQGRLRLFQAVAVFLAALARRGVQHGTAAPAADHGPPAGLLLILDDLHWADTATLDLLVHIVRHQPDAPLLILGAYREGEAAENPALERALARLEAHGPARAAFERALILLAGRGGGLTVQVLVDLGTLLAGSMGLYADGIAHARRALDRARRLGDRRLEAAATRTAGNLMMRSNDLAGGIPLLEHALALATAVDDPTEVWECCGNLVMAYCWTGNLRRAHEVTAASMEVVERAHDPYALRHVYAMLAALATFEADWAAQERYHTLAHKAMERLASAEPRGFLAHLRGLAAYLRGDDAVAEEAYREAVTIFRALGPGVLVWYLGSLALTLAARGKRAEALACMDEVEGLASAHPPASMPVAEAVSYLAATALLLGDRGRAVCCYPQLLPFRGQFHDHLVDRLLGAIKTLQGDWPAARAHLDQAERVAREQGIDLELGRVLADRAVLKLRRGGRDSAERAGALLHEALATFERLGMPGEARRARVRVEPPAAPGPRRPGPCCRRG